MPPDAGPEFGVTLVTAGGPVDRAVQIGTRSEGRVEIRTGLVEGDEVLLATDTELVEFDRSDKEVFHITKNGGDRIMKRDSSRRAAPMWILIHIRMAIP